jgi:nitroreductase/NAD-dependent dihydropyrimidine dehydrogenase PreA subunit
MSLITVDPDICTLCGNCLDECPFRLLEMKTESSFPSPREIEVRSAEERCINCGHCMAVCPTGALTLHAASHGPGGGPVIQNPDDCLPIRPELDVSREQMAQLLTGRRTHRAYLDRHVPRETIEEIIDVARYGPSGHNSQVPKWLVVSDKEEIRRLGQTVIDFMKANTKPNPDYPFWDHRMTDSDVIIDLWEKGEDSVFRGAPHLVILSGPSIIKDFYVAREQGAIRLVYLELSAIPYGIRTVWNGFFVAAIGMYPPAKEAVNSLLPKGYEVYDSMSIGYPKNVYQRIPMRNKADITWL